MRQVVLGWWLRTIGDLGVTRIYEVSPTPKSWFIWMFKVGQMGGKELK